MKKNSFQEITFNLKPAIRHDAMGGKPYLVVPMVMMTEGVHNGSNGPLYYPAGELGKLPVVWNHKPIVVYHPTKGTACSPDVLNARGVGVIMNTVFEDSKLKAEAWLEESRLKTVDERILNALNEGKMMEVSTGLFTDNEEASGDWNGEAYTAIARNHKPDHLAILPDMKGACSMEDGAGLLRLNQEKREEVINGKSFNQISDLINAQLRQKIKDAWVNDVFDTHFIYESNGGLYQQNYEIDKKDAIKFVGVPIKVIRQISYVVVNKNSNNNRKGNVMNKDKMIEQLISNAGTKWQESDKEYLTSLAEDVLEKMLPVENAMSAEEIAAKKKKDEEAAAADAAKNAADAAAAKNAEGAEKPQTAQDYIAKAPKEVQDVLTNGLNSYNKEKAKLVGVITANKKNLFTKEQLETKNLEELQAIANLAAPPKTVSYDGMGDVEDVTANTEEPLTTPVMNFKK